MLPDDTASDAPLLMPAMLRDLLPQQAQARVRESGRNRAVRKGSVLVEAGRVADSAIFFHAGWYALAIADVVVEFYGPGDAFLPPLDRAPARSPGRLKALTRGAVAIVPTAVLRDVLATEPLVSLGIANLALSMVMRSRVMYARMNRDPLEIRLAYVLWSLSEPWPDGRRRVVAQLPQAEIASFLGVPREEVSRKRRMLVRSGYLVEEDGETWMDPSTPMLLTSSGYELASGHSSEGLLQPRRAP